MKKVQIDPEQWVPLLVGMEEEHLVQQLNQGDIEAFIASLPSNIKFGQFSVLSISDLEENAKLLPDGQWPEFEIWNRDIDNWDNSMFDTSSLQVKLTSKRPVMYQVASNFNCQEEGLKSAFGESSLYSGFFLTNLMQDLTQGPSAAGGAGAGAILRWAQNFYQPINLLENTVLRPVGGKLTKWPSNVKIQSKNIKIGLHTNIHANFDRSSNDGDCFMLKPGLIIDQVFSSTVALKRKEDWLPEMQPLLQAAYQGTYLAAIQRQTRVLVLTLIGGSEFKNPLEKIYSSLAEAHCFWARKSSLQKVILPRFNNASSVRLLEAELIRCGCPKEKIIIKTIPKSYFPFHT